MVTEEMSVVDHLHELRKRLIIIIAFVSVAAIITYDKVYYLIKILLVPIAKYNLELVYFSLTEGFTTRMEISLFIGVIVTSPVILYQVAAFINPGLTKKEKKFLYKNIFFVSILFFGGLIFGYTLTLPYTLSFLISYGQGYMTPLLSGSTYFNFIGVFCFLTGIMFLIPYLIVLLSKISLLSSSKLKKWRKYVIIFILTLEGLFISNAGLLTCTLIAAPILLLYEISIWIVYFIEKRKEIIK
ncbi:Sec-independent protein translocase protein TatC [Clostridium polyendosporum]|uniref:Sec-independent protein translocase protein TatC n=1 Tax=Clostridium polyendosporum TaxID=69208 RepID=A0A919VKZ9_9CLOT|nr:twin-arginine translocase subunit TatC [Clostridium polyendosporum]GIM28083.1 Sec-independent protein translocase protein TatC [Clostridium polyendosporum]